MWEKVVERLLTVKSLVTLCLTAVFSFLACRGLIDAEKFITIFTVIISFYFGTQAQKAADQIGASEDKSRE